MNNQPETPLRPSVSAQGRPKEMRRSSRLTIEIPVEVVYKGSQNDVHTEETRTSAISAHGCALSLKIGLQPNDTIVLIHKLSREEISSRVVWCRQAQNGTWEAGVAFQSPSSNFWHIAFPPDDWDPSLRDQDAAPVKK